MSLLWARVDVCPAKAIRALGGFWRQQNKIEATHYQSLNAHIQQHIFIKENRTVPTDFTLENPYYRNEDMDVKGVRAA